MRCPRCKGAGTVHEDPDHRSGLSPWTRREIVMAGLRSGHTGTARLAMQLAGYGPCPGCDFILAGCRCYDTGKGVE